MDSCQRGDIRIFSSNNVAFMVCLPNTISRTTIKGMANRGDVAQKIHAGVELSLLIQNILAQCEL